MTDIAVTGATGYLGGAVARRLLAAGISPRLVVRDPSRCPSDLAALDARAATYSDTAAMTSSLRGVEVLYLVSATEDEHRVDQHRAAVDAAVAAGVTRIVYTSFVGAAPDATFTFARDHFATEQHIRSTGVDRTFLRSSLYVDFLPGMVGDDGVLRGPAGSGHDGGVSWVARDDIADVVTAVLRTAPADETFDVTGPEALTVDQTMAVLSQVAGREIRYDAETLDEARESRLRAYNAAAFEVEGWISTYAAIPAGELAAVSTTVPDLAGHPAVAARDWLRDHPEAWARLAP